MRAVPSVLCLCGFAIGTGRVAGQAVPVDFLPAIATPADFDAVSIPSQLGGDVERLTKYLLPASPDPALLPPLFQNVARYPFHFEFLRAVFADRFPALDIEGYLALVERRATRRYFAGAVSRFRTPDGVFYGYSVFTDYRPGELLDAAETRGIHEALARVFAPRPLYYAPDSVPAIDAARAWRDPGFPVYLGRIAGTFEAYTQGVGYGRVRLLSPAELEEAGESGRISWQDILVLERAPSDIEGVVAGVLTAEPQGELSHLAIRTARRGTPNAYLAGALDALRPFEGKLVRLEVTMTEYAVSEATPAEAEAWWGEHRPRLSAPPPLDPDHEALAALEEIDLAAPTPPEGRFGGKATNFARLQRILTPPLDRYREKGFAIPVRHYLEFLRSNRMGSAVTPGRIVTYEEYLREVLASPSHQSDAVKRFEALKRFRDRAEDDGVVDPALLARVAGRIVEVFGAADVPVRFRSSSNVEDALEFNGAGLYSSTTGCAADELDGDNDGPSACDPAQPDERSLARALKRVWTSLWSFRAVEERSYYQIPQDRVAMAVLVSAAFLDERANGVAFTGNPSNAFDRRYLVVAQVGEASVVSPEPGIRAEKDVLEVKDGAVLRIERLERSSLAPPLEPVVIPDASLGELAAVLWRIEAQMPVDLGAHDRSEVLFDVEFKLEAGGDLAIKQVRPFLVAPAGPPGPIFELEVPAGTVACGVFVDGRPPRGEHEAKCQVRFAAGKHALATAAPSFPGQLFDEVLYGPERTRLEPAAPGRFGLDLQASGGGNTTYSFRHAAAFALPGGGELLIELSFLDFTVRRGEPPPAALRLDEEYLAERLVMLGVPGADRNRLVRFSSCSYSALPLWRVRAELAEGGLVELEERFRVPLAGSGPANLVRAAVTLGGERRDVSDYWSLVYAAQHHNERVQYWVVLDPPLAVPGAGAVRVVELAEPQPDRGEPARAHLLDARLQPLASPAVACWRKALDGEDLGACGFRRGDADASGAVNLTDAVFTLRHLFQGGPPSPCPDAADFNDDGIVEITDPVLVLTFLFRGADLSEPPGPYDCGADPTFDGLAECGDGGCS